MTKRARDGKVRVLSEDLGVALKYRRKSLGMTQKDLAELVGTKQAYISNLENGRYGNIQLDTLVRFSNALGYNVTIGMDEEQSQNSVLPRSGDKRS